MKTFSMISLGCPRNLVDSECIISEFKSKGYRYKEDIIGADIAVINTCAFIEDAKKESIDTILKLVDAKTSGDVKKIIVVGCLPERYKDELKKELPEIDEFRGILDFKKAPTKRTLITPKHYAYIKISEGCRNRCTYCIIPSIKGPYRSRPIVSVVEEARSLIRKNIKEIILVGQDTSLYGIDLYRKKRLRELLKKVDKISRANWIRLLYLNPANLDRDVIDLIGGSKNICKYIDLPIEHISDRILKGMGRSGRKKDIVSMIEYIRKTIPGVSLRSSVIVGFPGEREKDFNEMASFLRDIKFERLGVFRYSREEETPAYKFKNQVSEAEKEDRFNKLMKLQQDISREINESFKGKKLRVLIDEEEGDYYIGRTEYDAPEVDGVVYVKGKGLKIGDFVDVTIVDTYEYDLVGIPDEAK